MHINPRIKAKDLVKMMAEAGKIVSISTVKRVLYQHGLKGPAARKKPLLQKKHKKARLMFANAHRNKDLNFWRHVPWPNETKISVVLGYLGPTSKIYFGGPPYGYIQI